VWRRSCHILHVDTNRGAGPSETLNRVLVQVASISASEIGYRLAERHNRPLPRHQSPIVFGCNWPWRNRQINL